MRENPQAVLYWAGLHGPNSAPSPLYQPSRSPLAPPPAASATPALSGAHKAPRRAGEAGGPCASPVSPAPSGSVASCRPSLVPPARLRIFPPPFFAHRSLHCDDTLHCTEIWAQSNACLNPFDMFGNLSLSLFFFFLRMVAKAPQPGSFIKNNNHNKKPEQTGCMILTRTDLQSTVLYKLTGIVAMYRCVFGIANVWAAAAEGAQMCETRSLSQHKKAGSLFLVGVGRTFCAAGTVFGSSGWLLQCGGRARNRARKDDDRHDKRRCLIC